MSKRRSNFKVRIEFEPNRFAPKCLAEIYEQLKPVDSRVVSNQRKENERQKKEKSKAVAAIEGGEK